MLGRAEEFDRFLRPPEVTQSSPCRLFRRVLGVETNNLVHLFEDIL